MVQSNLLLFYCAVIFRPFSICISSWHQEYLRGRKHKTKLNPVILSAQMCLVYIPGAALAGKHCRVCRWERQELFTFKKTLILHGKRTGEGDSDSLCLLSPGNTDGKGWEGSWLLVRPKILALGDSLEQGRADAFTVPRSVFHIRAWQSSVILHGGHFPWYSAWIPHHSF